MIWMIIKHFICDFVLQGSYIAKYKATKPLVLILHALINAFGSLLVLMALGSNMPILALIEIPVHAGIDYAKGKLPFKPDQNLFWVALGADQMLHMLWLWYIVRF